MYALKSPIAQVMSNTYRNSVQFSGKIQQLIVFSNTVRSCAKKVLQYIISPSAILMKRSVKRS